MQQTDFESFRSRMAAMARLFNADLDAALLDLYWLALRDWSLADFEGAVAHLLVTSKFMPKPADFSELRKQAGISAAEACAEVFRLVQWGYAQERERLPAKALHVVALMGGWNALEMAESSTRHFREKKFCDLWDEVGEIDSARHALPSAAPRISSPRSVWALLQANKTDPGNA
jgi:hypothetical protein